MWQLLTRCCTGLPPNPLDIDFDPDGHTTVVGLTYGGGLIFDRIAEEYDEPLRCLITWCMSKCLPSLMLDCKRKHYTITLDNLLNVPIIFDFYGIRATPVRTFLR